MRFNKKFKAFTMAEVLITLGVIGVVAALVLPTVMNNIQERVRKEQVRNVKYKLTLATDKMKSQGLIMGYPTTKDFINELSNHFKIVKVCDNDHLEDCWPTKAIEVPQKPSVFTKINVKNIKTGKDLVALSIDTASTTTMGIVTADGTPMILTYSPSCTPLDEAKTYKWSTVDNKPETNATTNCISAIFDINGKKAPNKIGQDVRTLNSLFGFIKLDPTSVSKDECEKLKSKGLINACYYETDYYAGAVKKCNEYKLHLPSMQTLANIAGTRYGRTDITTETLIAVNGFTNDPSKRYENCKDFIINGLKFPANSDIICVDNNLPVFSGTSLESIDAGNIFIFWSNSEYNELLARGRAITEAYSLRQNYRRNNSNYIPLCVGD